MKKWMSLILAVSMLTALFAPFSALTVGAATVPADVTEATVLQRLSELQALAGKYFTTDGTASSYNADPKTLLSNVLASTNANNPIIGMRKPTIYTNCPAHWLWHAAKQTYKLSTIDGYTCYGFANYALWYIFSQKSTDKVTASKVATGYLDYNTMVNYVKPGDVIRIQYEGLGSESEHSIVVLYYTDSYVAAIDSNNTGLRDNKIQISTFSYSGRWGGKPLVISRADNYVDCSHPSYNDKGICTNCNYQFPYDNGRAISCAGTYKVKSGTTAYIRKGPYQGCEEITRVTSGTFSVVAQVLNCKGNFWYEIDYKGSTCYIVSKNLEFVRHIHCISNEYEPAHPHREYTICSECGKVTYTGKTRTVSSCTTCFPEVCNCSASYAGEYICTTSSGPLSIRSGHGTSYSRIGTIPHGATVTVTKANGTWAHVTYNGISGYSSMDYLTKKVAEAPVTYTVTFVGRDGGTLKTETVEYGKAATAPAAPALKGYTFTGWDKGFDSITSNLTVRATYVENKPTSTPDEAKIPAIKLETVSAKAGEEVSAKVLVENNPGLAGLVVTVNLPEGVTLVKADNGDVFPAVTAGKNLVFDSAENITKDGTLAVLTLKVSEGVSGEKEITATIQQAVNAEYEDVAFTSVAGKITVDEVTGLWGDANMDGEVDAVDAMLVLQYSVELPVEIDEARCDVDFSETIDAVDAMRVLQYSVELVEELPIVA